MCHQIVASKLFYQQIKTELEQPFIWQLQFYKIILIYWTEIKTLSENNTLYNILLAAT